MELRNDILEPISEYNSIIKQKHHDNAVKFFDELAKKGNVNVEENRYTCKQYSIYQKKVDDASKQLKKLSVGSTLSLILLIILPVLAALFAIILNPNNALVIVISVVVGVALVALGIVIMVMNSKKSKAIKTQQDAFKTKANGYLKEAYSQMSGLNSLFDDNMAITLLNKSIPLIKIDPLFTNEACDLLKAKYGFVEANNDKNVSTINLFSGKILNNPFVYKKDIVCEMKDHVYTGTLVIHWTTVRHTKEGTVTVPHTQTLTATLIKPRPEYRFSNVLIYGNEAAPDLKFSRKPSNINSLKNEKEIKNYVAKHEKDLTKMAEEAVKNGKTFTPLGNSEFDLFFNAFNRTHETQFRLLFTPLAQKNMMSLLKDKNGYGDDFYFTKDGCLNFISSRHGQNQNLFVSPTHFMSFNHDQAKEVFVKYQDNFLKSIYFDFAPLLSIPLYQQHEAMDYSYLNNYESNFTNTEQESLINSFDIKDLQHKDTDTNVILKSQFLKKNAKTDRINIHAHSYQAIRQIEHIPTIGGDGRTHLVPVEWFEYVPLERVTEATIAHTGGTYLENQKYLQNGPLAKYLASYNTNSSVASLHGLIGFTTNKVFNEKDGEKLEELILASKA